MQFGKAHTINKACDLYIEVGQEWFAIHKARSLGFTINDMMHFSLFNLLYYRRVTGNILEWRFKKHPALTLLPKDDPIAWDTKQILQHRLNTLKFINQ